MVGTIVNAIGILAGGIAGLTLKTPIAADTQKFLKLAIGLVTVFFGLRLTWASLHGPFLQILKQLGIVVLALMLGKLTGRLLHLQKASNRLGQFARLKMAAARPGAPDRFNAGFQVCTALFCAAPLGILGAVQDGLSGYFAPLAIKGAIDGLAALGFVTMFGWGVLVSALPVVVCQGTITLLCLRYLKPVLEGAPLDAMNATGGLLVFCVALLILDWKKIEVTDYLPALVYAPLLAAWWG